MTRDELFRLLDEHPRKLRDFRAPGVDLRGGWLEQAEFENADLSGAIFSGCDLYATRFSHCILDRAAFDGTTLYKGDFSQCSLLGATFCDANLRRSGFHRISLKDADLRNADLTMAGFSDLDLRGADLTGAIFYETVMLRVVAHGARGAWFRPEDNRIEHLDMSEAGDGSDMRDARALIDREHGKPRPIHIRLTAFSDVIREEPNAREHDIGFDELPVDDKLRGELFDWRNALADAYNGNETADPVKLAAADRQGRKVWRALSDALKEHLVRYEPPHEGAAIEDAPQK
jgi:uncharacterized protein YjbI with pentapeptide repeats